MSLHGLCCSPTSVPTTMEVQVGYHIWNIKDDDKTAKWTEAAYSHCTAA